MTSEPKPRLPRPFRTKHRLAWGVDYQIEQAALATWISLNLSFDLPVVRRIRQESKISAERARFGGA